MHVFVYELGNERFVVIDAFISIKLREVSLFKGNSSPLEMAFVFYACVRVWMYLCTHYRTQQTIVIRRRDIFNI